LRYNIAHSCESDANWQYIASAPGAHDVRLDFGIQQQRRSLRR
jgi:hypothetical protein